MLELRAVSGQARVPVPVDPGRDEVVIESKDIIDYLQKHYGQGER